MEHNRKKIISMKLKKKKQSSQIGSGKIWTVSTKDEGVFSIAMIQANAVLEDQCHLKSGSLNMDENGPRGTFVGVYDGHVGPETAWFIKDHLFEILKNWVNRFGNAGDTVLEIVGTTAFRFECMEFR